MSDNLPTVWKADPHTLAKHGILHRYLNAWFPILTRQAGRLRRQYGKFSGREEILYIDGFAGPGKYTGGEIGSPIIALRSAMQHSAAFPVPVRMLFIELDEKRFASLQDVIAPQLEIAKESTNVHAVEPFQGDCDDILNRMLDEYENKGIKFGPALAFLDQFGYGAVSMELIGRIMSYSQCEVFTYLNYKDMNRWIGDPNKATAFTRAFGNEDWKQCVDLPERQRREKLLELYKTALRDQADAEYVVSFLMFDFSGVPLYWLLFCTNSLRGLEEMKKAMWAVDKSGEFKFSDKDDPSQLSLLTETFDERWLAGELSSQLSGQTISVAEVREFVLVKTPCYLFKGALRLLESQERLTVIGAPPRRKPGKYPDDAIESIKVRFPASLF